MTNEWVVFIRRQKVSENALKCFVFLVKFERERETEGEGERGGALLRGKIKEFSVSSFLNIW